MSAIATVANEVPTHRTDTHRLVRERTFPPSTPLHELLMYIRKIKGTGTLMIDLNQGGIGSIRFCEEQHLTFDPK
jgi:hypothetical protein